MNRKINAQDLSWFYDLYNRNLLNLEPPYQRRSVWTSKDRKYFLNTVLNNYPCPPIFLHKNTDENGKAIYNVIDGKQRLLTIFEFISNKIRLDDSYSNDRLDNKRWMDISDSKIRADFWDYSFSVEQLDFNDDDTVIVNDIFDRLNRNSKKLNSQELRHAKYSGWFNKFSEDQTNIGEIRDVWNSLGVSSVSRNKRMMDTQFISELMIMTISKNTQGFSQDQIDEYYALYDDLSSLEENNIVFSEDDFSILFSKIRDFIFKVNNHNGCIKLYFTNNNFYTIWNYLINKDFDSLNVIDFSEQYLEFMEKVQKDNSGDINNDKINFIKSYQDNSTGASTELNQRRGRLEALSGYLG
ncbi:DUF262 domain-containing protein [Acinetobacter sp. MYb177]|uniref:DUF262 domain-containing protein n=1 Tax=unclassified Acinetobacter TaxID=196816 RepID=UPI0030AAC595